MRAFIKNLFRNLFNRLFFRSRRKAIKGWFCPPHVCKRFRQYYGLNLKICDECKKESPLWEMNIIKHQR